MSHRPTFANRLKSLGRTVFRTIALMIIDEICLENPCQQLCFSVCCFLPTELSLSYFPRFPIRPRCPYFFRLAPSQRSSPQAISHGFPSLPSRSFPTELSPSYFFPRFPSRSFPTELSPSFASTPCGLILEILNLETRWAREPESKTAHSTPFFEHVVVWAAVLWTKSM